MREERGKVGEGSGKERKSELKRVSRGKVEEGEGG